MSEDTLRAALRAADLPEAAVRYDDVVDSTNSIALAMARAGAPEWTLVAAAHQTAGRGRLGRRWESEPGRALQFSFVLRPRLPPGEAALVTLLAGAGMADAAAAVGVPGVRCKWPNDLLLRGAKVGGILAEAAVAGGRIEHVVVGIGVNLSSPPPGMEGAGGLGDVDAGKLLTSFLVEVSPVCRWGHLRFSAEVLARYRPHCETLGRRVRASTVDGRTVEGDAVGLDVGGSLIVDTPEGTATVAFGEVEHLR
jgi:BirA family transcriptional regulator, biotin operon repressor / biotin---[acetyl-CoA-carboxylase] ligase